MKSTIFIITLYFLFGSYQILYSQKIPCLCNEKGFNYRALFIDSLGDTLTNEIIEVKPLNKKWLFGLLDRETKVVKYGFNTDSIGYKKINDRFITDNALNARKKNKRDYVLEEKTGFTCTKTSFFTHPPRQNQYKMMYYAAYPVIDYTMLNDSIEHFALTMNILGPVDAVHRYEIFPFTGISPLKDSSDLQLWTVNANTDVTGLSDYYESQHYHDSKMEGLYCPEIGFIRMHYTFENGVRIYFDYVEENK